MLTRYEYQGSPHIVELHPGRYLLECYGAQGGTGCRNSDPSPYTGGKGAYASGILDLQKTTLFYLYIGCRGEDGPSAHGQTAKGGWNGGGDSGADTADSSDLPDTSGGGGGATDIRLVVAPEGEEATNEESLNSRIIVAAGGSGSAMEAYGAPGGDLAGYVVTANQLEAYAQKDLSGSSKGKGANGENHPNVPSSGAGGGFFGGIASQGTASSSNDAVSSSGSSYVSGFPGCEEFTHELGRVFGYRLSHPHISNGLNTFPSFAQDETKLYETGHEGNGAIKITRLKTCSVCACRKSNILVYVAIIIINTSTE